jgi:hypothetical protein
VSDFLTHGLSLGTDPCTAIAVVTRDGGANEQGIFAACAPNTPLGININGRFSGSPNWAIYLNAVVTAGESIDGAWSILSSVMRSGTDVDLVTNGHVETLTGSGFYGGNGLDRRVIGAGDTTGGFFRGSIASLIAFPAALSGTNRSAVESLLAAYYDITLTS